MLRQRRSLVAAAVTLATFTDIVAYSIAIPVLPALSRKLGASPTMIGLLFASFGVTLLTVSVPMGAVSDRLGRKAPIVGGLIALGSASLLFAFADTLPWLFAARLILGAADAVTWVVGFALIADLYDASERGRISGIVMMGTSCAVMIGPTLGGWLYEIGGIRMPFIALAVLSAAAIAFFLWLDVPEPRPSEERVPVGLMIRVPAIAACAVAVVAIAGTITMLEPVMSLHLGGLGVNPGRIGMMYGAAAVITTSLHPIMGRLADRIGARRMMMIGFVLCAALVPVLGRARTFFSAVALYVACAGASTFIISPSLAFMGDATNHAGVRSFGVAYGLYNLAWGAGLLSGPALGGFLFERLGFPLLLALWGPSLALVTLMLARLESQP